jgi:hypothetical protein
MLTKRKTLLPVAVLWASCVLNAEAATDAARIAALEAQLQQQQAAMQQQQRMLETMQAELQQLKAGESGAPLATTAVAPAEQKAAVASAAPANAAKGAGKANFEVYGFAQLDAIQDFNRVNPDWEDTLRPSKIPTVSGAYGSDGQSLFSVKQSRLGVQSNLPVGDSSIYTKFEFDLFGTGSDAGQTTIRVRHAYGQYKELLAGQTNSLFMDGDAFPNVIDYWGPAGMVFLRNPQIRWTPISGENSFAVALEKPNGDIDSGQFREVDPSFAQNVQGDEKYPDLTMQYRTTHDWGHVQVAGVLRDVGYDSVSTPSNKPKGDVVGWGVDLTSNIKTVGKDKIILAAVYGEAIASYMNDGGVDLAPSGTLANPDAQGVPLLGLEAYYDHYWSELWSSSIGYSSTEVDNQNLQQDTAFKKGQYASANLLFYPVKNVMYGGELLWGQLEDNGGATGDDVRVQFSFKYNFSSNDFKGAL